MNPERVVVIGAGLSGLAVAARLGSAGQDVLVVEAGSRAGGQIQTERSGELVVELGAEGFVARSRTVPDLCALLGIQGELIEQLTTDTYALEHGALSLLPPGEAARRLGFQVPVEELGRGIRSFSRGMGQLVDALLAHLGSARVRLRSAVTGVDGRAGALTVTLAEGEQLSAGAVVLAIPARPAASVVAPFGLTEVVPLRDAPLLSNVSVNLLYRRAQLQHYPAGSGVIFPESYGEVGLRALSLVDHKLAGRVPAGESLLRVFFRPVGDALSTWTDERFSVEAARAVSGVLGAAGEPARAWVSRWADALPVFSAEYRAQAAAADQALQARGVHVAGSAFHGAGIDAALASAEIVAARLSSAAKA